MYGWGYRQKLAAIVIPGAPDDCWPVTRGVDKDGYAHLGSCDTAETLVHRLVMLAEGKEIPPGHEVDHTCRTRNCANPRHLDIVPKLVNLSRAREVLRIATECLRGHPRTPSNLYADGSCKMCRRGGKPPRTKAAFCKRGHARTPDNLNTNRACKKCVAARGRLRRQSHRTAVVQS